MSNGFRVDQMQLVSVIMAELNRQIPDLPLKSRFYNRVISAANGICEELAKPLIEASESMGLRAWLVSDDVDSSSRFMASVLSGQFSASFAVPSDPDDFGRCVRLFLAVPELKADIDKMRQHGPAWISIVDNWTDWEGLYQAGQTQELFALMSSVRHSTSRNG